MKKILYALAVCTVILTACKEDNLMHPYGENDHKAPGEVSNIRVEKLPGGAVLRYDRPDDADLFYVKAVYKSTNGEVMDARSSGYVDSLQIVGFGDTNEYEVKLYCVDRFENISQGVSTTVVPDTPPVQTVFESLEYTIDFGGFYVDFENKSKSNVAIYVVRRDTISNEFVYYDALYTSMVEGRYAVRGLPSKENEFGIYVRDRYDNISQTLFFTGTPYREDALNKKLIVNTPLVGDTSFDFYSGKLTNAWDGQVVEHVYAHTDFPVKFPHRFTIDLGVDVKMSRIHMWQRSRWEHGSWYHFKVYGCFEKPLPATAQNPMEGWIELGDFTSVKPSGLPLGQTSSEDLEKYSLGEEFPFDRNIPVVRYLRFEILESWSGMECSTMSELSFWGEIQEKD